MSKTTVAYRIPNEKDYFSIFTGEDLQSNNSVGIGFIFSDFDSGIIYTIKNSEIRKNQWLDFEPHFRIPNPEISKEEYLSEIVNITESIQHGDYKKVVFSRIKKVEKKSDFNLKKVFETLCELYPSAFVYAISSPEIGTWMGASPELLLHQEKDIIKTVSLAGTRVNGVEWTDKEKHEQQVVTDYIIKKISPISENIKVSNPNDLNTGSVIHLKSEIEFKLKKNNIWELVRALHPTPAVCGIPTTKAKKLIKQVELQERNLYTGFIGPMGINNHSSLFVNLRCMQIHKESISIYVGGGIMGNSNPEKEWEETENKAKTMLNSL